MAKITIDKDKCKACWLCVAYCAQGLIKKDKGLNKLGYNFARFSPAGNCSGCAMCALICPDCCIEVYK